jgi:hypothetical protein
LLLPIAFSLSPSAGTFKETSTARAGEEEGGEAAVGFTTGEAFSASDDAIVKSLSRERRESDFFPFLSDFFFHSFSSSHFFGVVLFLFLLHARRRKSEEGEGGLG